MGKVIILFMSLVLLSACQPPDEAPYRGYLYFTQGPYLMRFSMRDSSLEAVTHLGDKKIREISRFGPNRLLISETATLNQKTIARISWIDLETGEAQALYAGVRARFVDGTIVYDDGSKLFSIKQENGTEAAVEVLTHKRFQLTAMVEISDGRLLIETREDGEPMLRSLDTADGSLTPMDPLAMVCSLRGAVWIDDLELLACRERGGDDGEAGGHIFASLDGRFVSRPSLPEGEQFQALAYIADQGILIFREIRRSPIEGANRFAAWAHDVRSGENRELSDTINLGSSVVFSVY